MALIRALARRPAPVLADRVILLSTALFGLVALGLLIAESTAVSTPVAVAAIIYGATLATSAVCSLIYNVGHHHRPRGFWRAADHIAIFLLIAGTYTPVALTGTANPATDLLIPVWVLAVGGSILKVLLRLRHERLFVALYLVTGWVIALGLRGFAAVCPTPALILILAGGLAFTGGTLFYLFESRWRWSLAGWHASVLVGMATQFIAIFGYLIPAG